MIGIHDPWLGERERAEVLAALDSNWLSGGGAKGDELERGLASFFGLDQPALAAASGSAALLLALRAAGVTGGDHVLVSDYGFIATANAVRHACAEPIFLGCASALDPVLSTDLVLEFLDREVTREGVHRETGRAVRGLLYNEPFGFACARLGELRSELAARGMFLIEDASQAIGIRSGGRFLGTFGQLGVFSFNGNKTISLGSGGALLGRDAAWLASARHLSRQARIDGFDFLYDDVGYNFTCSNVLAAIGVAQMRKLPEILARKNALRAEYARLLAGTGWALAGPAGDFPAWLNVAISPRPRARDEWVRFAGGMKRRGVQVRPVFPAVTLNSPYEGARRFGAHRGDEFFARGLCLPSGAALSGAEAARVVDALVEESRG